MKLLAVRLARSIWLMPPYFLNPKGLFIRPAIEAMKIRYSFLKTPLNSPIPQPADEGIKFENGVFDGKNGKAQITSVTLHNDGIVIDMRSSTDDADLLMEDIIAWAHGEYGLPALSELPVKRLYVSELNVAFERTPGWLNPKLAPLLDDVSSAISDENKGTVDVVGFQFGTDQTRSKSPGLFKIEREINTAFEENRYYSFAATKTETHRELLEKIERLAA